MNCRHLKPLKTSEISQRDRAYSIGRARKALAEYRERSIVGRDHETNITDLLADLRLFAQAQGVDFERCVEVAAMHWHYERQR